MINNAIESTCYQLIDKKKHFHLLICCLFPAKGEVVLHLTSLPLGVAKEVLQTETHFTPAFLKETGILLIAFTCYSFSKGIPVTDLIILFRYHWTLMHISIFLHILMFKKFGQ
jgi:hypothetical protein